MSSTTPRSSATSSGSERHVPASSSTALDRAPSCLSTLRSSPPSRGKGWGLALLPALWTTSAPGAFGSSPCVRSSVPICAVTASTRIWWPAAQLTQSDHGPAARGGSTPPPSYLRGPGCPWHNSSRCIGRLYWRSLRVATNRGRVRPTLTVFAPSAPERPGPRIWNEQLIRYAGYRRSDGTVIGDPRYAHFTSALLDLGRPGGPGTPLRRAAARRPGSRRTLQRLVHGHGDRRPQPGRR